jgi:ribosomal protein S12 methylthiotransferase
MALQRRICLRRNRALVGQRLDVLVEGVHPESEHLLQGRTAGQAPEIDGAFIINAGRTEQVCSGTFEVCEVTAAHAYDLVGRIVSVPSTKSA